MSAEQPKSFSLTADDARKLAQASIRYGLRLLSTLTGHPPGPEELVRILRIGMTVDQIVRPILGQSPIADDQTERHKMEKLLACPPEAIMEELENVLTNGLLEANPEEVARIKATVDKMEEWSEQPTWPRKALVAFAKQQWQGKPGPTPKIPRDAYPEVAAKADALRPVCEMVLEFALKKTKQPLSQVIEAVKVLRPEWQAESSFLLENLALLEEGLHTARVKRAKGIRSKAHNLADALACTCAGYPASPSYSIQVVGEARRSK